MAILILLLVVAEVAGAVALIGLYLRHRAMGAQVDALRAEVALARIEGVLGQGDLDPQRAGRHQQR
ncbi:hypothetical protein [Streptomyces sp. NPDC048438]|uniref:hypothetical protein n=1 Tax=Streptomyces sp. NPDC048438 TaxID=3365551 RepID=UPI003724AEEA